eukprot:TRINITY_DN63905_c0_g1_i1.p1 TRINITY_DN63905_c0_g1~~TRINITY_DN63905_c0_g1_i1.p1  ORF type:complete len:257 (-),score=54.89 TRINITY_DN63905_c0_g1_i1:227-970(-)
MAARHRPRPSMAPHIQAAPAPRGFQASGKGTGRRCPPEPSEAVGEVRFDNADDASRAQRMLDGSRFAGSIIKVCLDPSSFDYTKLRVFNVPRHVPYQEMKEHFGRYGFVHFASTGHKNVHKDMKTHAGHLAQEEAGRQRQRKRKRKNRRLEEGGEGGCEAEPGSGEEPWLSDEDPDVPEEGQPLQGDDFEEIVVDPDEPLPFPWVMVNEEDGSIFYHNEVTGESQWSRPSGSDVEDVGIEVETSSTR